MATRPTQDRAPAPASTVEVHVAPMRRRHLRAVLRIEGQNGPGGWSLGLFMGELANEAGRRYLVARVGGSVVGFAGLLFVGDEGHVTTVAVDEAHRRHHVGARLFAALCRDAIARGTTALTLEVRTGNEAAQAMYRRFGFAPAGIRRNYYPDTGEDALVMWAHDVDGPAYAARLDAIEAEAGPVVLDDPVGRRRLDGSGVVMVDRPGDAAAGPDPEAVR